MSPSQGTIFYKEMKPSFPHLVGTPKIPEPLLARSQRLRATSTVGHESIRNVWKFPFKKTDISQTSLLLKWNNLACWCTSCSSRIVFSSTNVVFRVFVQILRIHGIGVDHENIHGETGINEIHMLTPICSRKSPTGGFPGVSNLLIPAVVKDSASPVMISKHAEPNLQGNNPEKKTNRNKSIKPLGL